MVVRAWDQQTRGDGAMVATTKAPACDNQVIKQSIAYRAKYRKGQSIEPFVKLFALGLVVPHPKNLGAVTHRVCAYTRVGQLHRTGGVRPDGSMQLRGRY